MTIAHAVPPTEVVSTYLSRPEAITSIVKIADARLKARRDSMLYFTNPAVPLEDRWDFFVGTYFGEGLHLHKFATELPEITRLITMVKPDELTFNMDLPDHWSKSRAFKFFKSNGGRMDVLEFIAQLGLIREKLFTETASAVDIQKNEALYGCFRKNFGLNPNLIDEVKEELLRNNVGVIIL